MNARNGRTEYLTNLPSPTPINEELQNERWTYSQEWLIIYRDSALYRLRHDGRDFGVILEDVAFPAYFDWSEDGNTLLFRAYHGGNTTSFLLNIATGELTQLGHFADAQFSADGQLIIIERGTDAQDVRLFRMRLDGTDELELTDGYAYGIDYELSPDGAWIIYVGCVSFECDLHRVRLDGSDHEQLTTDDNVSDVIAWLDEGKSLVFASFGPSCEYQLHRLDITTGIQIRLGEDVLLFCERSRFQAFAPDYESVIYSAMDANGLSSSSWLIPMDGGDAVELSGVQQSAWVMGWSPDGEWLLLDGPIGGIGTDHQLFRFDFKTGDLHKLTEAINFSRYYTWSPVIEMAWNVEILAILGLAAIGGSFCVGYWFLRS